MGPGGFSASDVQARVLGSVDGAGYGVTFSLVGLPITPERIIELWGPEAVRAAIDRATAALFAGEEF